MQYYPPFTAIANITIRTLNAIYSWGVICGQSCTRQTRYNTTKHIWQKNCTVLFLQ